MNVNHPQTLLMDFDDFCDKDHEIDSLLKLRNKNGKNFKVTLFTIPGKSTVPFLKKVTKKFPWIELAIHGWDHHGVGECLSWDKPTALRFLKKALEMKVFVPGFKAPNWLASKATYDACKEIGLWVAEISINKEKIPNGVTSYVLDEPQDENIIQAHGHITNYPPNYIKTHLSDYIFGSKIDYAFINEYLKKKNV